MNDDIEKRIERQPIQSIPAEWREEILGTARGSVPVAHGRTDAEKELPTTSVRWISFLLRPQRAGWTALAAAWVVIITLNIAARDDSPGSHDSYAAAPPSPATLQALEQQRLLFVELIGRQGPHEAARPEADLPRPRSRRQVDSVAV